jgi:CRP-like cAMP-binding protein
LDDEHSKAVETSITGAVEDQIPKNVFMISPDSLVRRNWDFVVACCCIYIAWLLPFKLGFGDLVPEDWEDDHLYEVNQLVDVVFIVDLILSFRTAYWNADDHLVWDNKKVAVHYLTSWFIVDLIGSFPFSAVKGGISKRQGKSIKAFAKYWKIPKLLRLGRLLKYAVKYAQYFHLFKLLNFFFVCLHWNACLYASIAYGGKEGRDSIILNEQFGVGEEGVVNIGAMYAESLYISGIMICGFDRVTVDYLGTDDTTARGGWPDAYFMVVSVGGMFYFAYVVAHVTADVIMKTGERSRFQHKVERVTGELKKHYLPHELQVRVRKYYDILWRNSSKSHNIGHSYNDPDLSENLRCEIALNMHKTLLATVPLFESCDDMCLAQILVALQTQLYLRGEVVMHCGAPAHSMMIIAKGVVRVLSPDLKHVVGELKAGNFFGEMALIHKSRRSSTIYAATFVDVKILNQKDFKEIANEWPDFREQLESIAKTRTLQNQRTSQRTASATNLGKLKVNVQPVSPVLETPAKESFDGTSIGTGKALADTQSAEIASLSAEMKEIKALLQALVLPISEVKSGSGSQKSALDLPRSGSGALPPCLAPPAQFFSSQAPTIEPSSSSAKPPAMVPPALTGPPHLNLPAETSDVVNYSAALDLPGS